MTEPTSSKLRAADRWVASVASADAPACDRSVARARPRLEAHRSAAPASSPASNIPDAILVARRAASASTSYCSIASA